MHKVKLLGLTTQPVMPLGQTVLQQAQAVALAHATQQQTAVRPPGGFGSDTLCKTEHMFYDTPSVQTAQQTNTNTNYIARCATLKPRKYQVEAINFLREHKRAGLFDQPGMGKTLCASEAAQRPVLVAAPSYLVWQWHDFIRAEYPNESVAVAWGTRKQRNEVLARARTMAMRGTPYDWLIVNKEMLRGYGNSSAAQGVEGYQIPNATTLILDESHHFRGRQAQQTKGARTYASKCEYVFLLTGTPMMKAVDDIFAQLQIIAPSDFTSYHRFVEDHTYFLDTQYSRNVIKANNPTAFRRLLDRYSITRGYDNVGLELPSLIDKPVPLEADAAFFNTYKRIKSHWTYDDKDINSMMEAMHVMRKLTHQRKLEAALELMQDVPDDDGVVWFTWYTDIAESLGTILKCPVITGEVPPRERSALAKSSKMIVATMASMSEGVDLSHFKHVIFMEMDYVPGVLYQALSRVRRWGPTAADKIVTVYYLYVRNTLDHIIYTAARAPNLFAMCPVD